MEVTNPYDQPAAKDAPRICIAPDRISISTELTAADEHAATLELVKLRKSAVVPFLILSIVTFLVALGIITAIGGPVPHHHAHAESDSGIGFAGFLLGIVCLVVFLLVLAMVIRRRETIAKSRSPFLGTRTFDLGPDHIAMHGAGYRIEASWSLLQSVAVTPQAVWLLYHPLEGWWIPKKDIGDQKNVDAVVAFIRARNPAVVYERVDANGIPIPQKA